MLARKCDRCGALYEFYEDYPEGGNQVGFMKVNKNDAMRFNTSYIYDLCPGCMEKLVKFMKGDNAE